MVPGDIFILCWMLFWLFAFVISIVCYLLQGFGLMSMGKSLGINDSWFAFIPVGNAWLLGKIAEFEVKPGEKPKKWSRILLIMSFVSIGAAVFIFFAIYAAIFAMMFREKNAAHVSIVLLLTAFALTAALSIASAVLQYVCLYKTYRIFLPQSAAGMIVLNVLIPVSLPFVLFANRKKIPRNPYTGEPLGIYAGYYGYYPSGGSSYYG